MTCVCGHERGHHIPRPMSVAHVSKPTTYPIVGHAYCNVSATVRTAPLHRDECHCGCCEYLDIEPRWPIRR